MVALRIDIDGTKHPLALVESSIENATLVTELIVGLRERGLDLIWPGPGGAGRVQGDAPGRTGRVRSSGAGSVSAAQGSQRERSCAATDAIDGGAADASRVPRRFDAGCTGAAGSAGRRAGQDPGRRHLQALERHAVSGQAGPGSAARYRPKPWPAQPWHFLLTLRSGRIAWNAVHSSEHGIQIEWTT